MNLSVRELEALEQFCTLVETVPDLHEQWYESEDTSRLTDDEIASLRSKLKAMRKETKHEKA